MWYFSHFYENFFDVIIFILLNKTISIISWDLASHNYMKSFMFLRFDNFHNICSTMTWQTIRRYKQAAMARWSSVGDMVRSWTSRAPSMMFIIVFLLWGGFWNAWGWTIGRVNPTLLLIDTLEGHERLHGCKLYHLSCIQAGRARMQLRLLHSSTSQSCRASPVQLETLQKTV